MVDEWWALVSIAAAEHDVEAIRQHERAGRPLGGQAFLKRLEDSLGRALLHGKPDPKPRQPRAQSSETCVVSPE